MSLNDASDDLLAAGGAIEKICFVPRRARLSLYPSPFNTGKRTCESFDLFSDNINSSIITSIEFKDHLSHVFCTVYSSGQGENCGCFTGTGGSVKEKMR